MNSLGRNLKAGDKIVLRGGVVAKCGGQCFGSFTFATGRALDVYVDGMSVRADAIDDINVDETNKRFAVENGWEAA